VSLCNPILIDDSPPFVIPSVYLAQSEVMTENPFSSVGITDEM